VAVRADKPLYDNIGKLMSIQGLKQLKVQFEGIWALDSWVGIDEMTKPLVHSRLHRIVEKVGVE
jgi:hypothetical protein